MKTTEIINEEYYAIRLQQGDETAFRYIMNRYFAVITNFARRIVVNNAVAEDVAEETFIKLWNDHKKAGSFQSIKALSLIHI